MNNANPSKKASSIWRRSVSVFLGLFLSLALLEAGFRLVGFVQTSLHEYGNVRSLKQKNAYRILCLGDSTTQMQYPRFLEQVLNERNVGIRFSVIDEGSGGTNARAILSQVDTYLDKYHPDMVIAMMGNDDKGFGFFQENSMNDTGILRHSLLYRFVKMRFMNMLEKIKGAGTGGPHPGRKIKPGSDRSFLGKRNAGETPRFDLRGASQNRGTPSAHFDGARTPKSKNFLKTADMMRPGEDAAYVEAGRFYKEQGNYAQAEEAFRKAIEINPLNARAYTALGRIYKDHNQFSKAEAAFKKAIEIYPQNDSAYSGLGELYMNYGLPSQAEDAFKKVLELDPANEFTLIELGSVYRDQGELAKAEELLKKVIELNPERIPERTLRAMASLYTEMGRPELAKTYTEMAQRSGSEDNASVTVENYLKLKGILDKKGIRMVCMQYPLRNVESLKRIFAGDKSVVFIDNEQVFKEAVKRSGFNEYFRDMFGGDFGHCTQKGNMLLAENMADVILREVFNKK